MIATSFGRGKWLSLLSGIRLQLYCNKEGINVLGKMRIGIAGNNEYDCDSPNSFMGVAGDKICNNGVYSGNGGCYYASGSQTHYLPADVSILIKWAA